MPQTTRPPLSPLAREIYRQLVRTLRARRRSITYAALAAAVSARVPTHQRSRAFHAALGEVTALCRAHGLPSLPAMVWRAGAARPSPGYFAVAHPRARTPDARRAAWADEHAAVLREAAHYPARLAE